MTLNLTYDGSLRLEITSDTLYTHGKNLKIHDQVVHYLVLAYILKKNDLYLKCKLLGCYNISSLDPSSSNDG